MGEKEYSEVARDVIISYGFDPNSHTWIMSKQLSSIRKTIMYVLYTDKGMSTHQISKVFGIDSSVVAKAIKYIEHRSDNDKSLMEILNKIENRTLGAMRNEK